MRESQEAHKVTSQPRDTARTLENPPTLTIKDWFAIGISGFVIGMVISLPTGFLTDVWIDNVRDMRMLPSRSQLEKITIWMITGSSLGALTSLGMFRHIYVTPHSKASQQLLAAWPVLRKRLHLQDRANTSASVPVWPNILCGHTRWMTVWLLLWTIIVRGCRGF